MHDFMCKFKPNLIYIHLKGSTYRVIVTSVLEKESSSLIKSPANSDVHLPLMERLDTYSILIYGQRFRFRTRYDHSPYNKRPHSCPTFQLSSKIQTSPTLLVSDSVLCQVCRRCRTWFRLCLLTLTLLC